MELYKFISENEIKKYKGGFVVVNNRIYTNPTEEKIREAGYKELVEAPMLEINEDTEYVVERYIDGDVITLMYEVRTIEEDITVVQWDEIIINEGTIQ